MHNFGVERRRELLFKAWDMAFLYGPQTIPFAVGLLMAAGVVGSLVAMTFAWHASSDHLQEAAKRQRKAERWILIFAIPFGSGLAYFFGSVISHNIRLNKDVLTLIGIAGAIPSFFAFQKWHINGQWKRDSVLGIAREFFVFLVAALIFCLCLAAIWAAPTSTNKVDPPRINLI